MPHAAPRPALLALALTLPLLGSACCNCPPPEDGAAPADDGASFTPPARTDADGNHTVSSYDAARRRLRELFADDARTFYCDCRFTDKDVDRKSCGYEVRKSDTRAARVEWEHVVPAHAFGQSFRSWRQGHPDCKDSKGEPYKGRRCASKVDDLFDHMAGDLYNLRPAVGEVNGDRSNFSMAMIPGEARAYGRCDVEIDFAARKIEPRPEIRGDVARTYLYMDWAYPGRGVVSRKNRKLFEAWDHADPPDARERDWARRVEAEQGNPNPFIR